MPRHFVNNFSTTLSGNITAGQTTLPLQLADGAKLPSVFFDPPNSEDIRLTITDGTNTEEIRVTDHDGATDTIAGIERNVGDGDTGNFAFLSGDTVELRTTSDTLEELWLNHAPRTGALTARGSNNFEAVYARSSNSHVNASDQSVLIGGTSGIADNMNRSIVIGHFTSVLDTGNSGAVIAIGGSMGNIDSDDAILIGDNITLSVSGTRANRSVFITSGDDSISGDDSVGIGNGIAIDGDHAILIGTELGTFSGTDPMQRTIEIGWGWTNGTPNPGDGTGGLVMGIGEDLGDIPIPGMARITWPRAMGGSLEMEDVSTIKPSYANNGTEVTLCTERLDTTDATPFRQARAFYTWALPTNTFMYVTEFGIICDSVSGATSVTTEWNIDLGTSGSGSTDLISAQDYNNPNILPVARRRELHTPSGGTELDGSNAITLTVNNAAVYDAGTVFVYAYIKGIIWKGN